MPTSPIVQLQMAFAVAVVVFALWKGGAAERLTALVLLGITVRYGALWMGGVMLFYAAQFGMHSYYMVLQRPTGDYLNALVNNINFMGITWCLVIGTAVAWRRRVKAARVRATPAPDPQT